MNCHATGSPQPQNTHTNTQRRLLKTNEKAMLPPEMRLPLCALKTSLKQICTVHDNTHNFV